MVHEIGKQAVLSPAVAVDTRGESEVALRWTHRLSSPYDRESRKELQLRAFCSPRKGSLVLEGRAHFGEADDGSI